MATITDIVFLETDFMNKSKIVALSLCAGALLLPAVSQAADSDVKWGASAQTTRMQAEGTKTYYEPEKVERDGDVIRVKLYGSLEMSDTRVVDEVAVNCETHEMARLKAGAGTPAGKREWEAPSKIFAGEELYGTARELCGWGAGFWQKLAD